jgi:putative phosphoesterase
VRIGIISDTNIPDKATDIPAKILDAFKNVDMVIHCGDLIELKVLEVLKEVCKDVRAVRGNMDPLGVKEKLPEKEVIEIGGLTIAVTHGSGAPNRLIGYLTEFFKDEKADIIIFGHSHASVNERVGKVLFFNPGSATDKVFAPYNSYGIIEINGNQIKASIVRI